MTRILNLELVDGYLLGFKRWRKTMVINIQTMVRASILIYVYLSFIFDFNVILATLNICCHLYTIDEHCTKYEPTSSKCKINLGNKKVSFFFIYL